MCLAQDLLITIVRIPLEHGQIRRLDLEFFRVSRDVVLGILEHKVDKPRVFLLKPSEHLRLVSEVLVT